MNKMVSIVVPVFNSEDTIERCLSSLIKQTYADIEIIVVNDGSKDDSIMRIKKYSSKVILLNQKNSGVSVARNNGLKRAKGDYILFVDSDDCLNSDFVEKMVAQANSDDLVIGRLICIDEKRQLCKISFNTSVNGDDEMLRMFDKLGVFPLIGAPTFKLYRKQIIEKYKISFIDGLSLGEDTCFVLDYLSHVKKARFVDNADYYCYIRNHSLSRTDHSDIWKIQTIINRHYDDFVSAHNGEKNSIDGNFYFRSVRIALNTATKYKWSRKMFKNLCEEIVESKILDRVKRPQSFYQKILYDCLLTGNYNLMRCIIRAKNVVKTKGY